MDHPQHITVVSGGQVGVDEGALKGAAAVGLNTAGYMPKGFRRSGGKGVEFAAKYGLKETTYGTGRDSDRDRQNADMSDLLIAFLVNKPLTGRGTRDTLRYAYNGDDDCVFWPDIHEPHSKPRIYSGQRHCDCVVVWDANEDNWEGIADRLSAMCCPYKTIMFSGPVEATSPGITDTVEKIVKRMFSPHHQHNE